MTQKFTDNLLATLYLNISKRYKGLKDEAFNPDRSVIYSQIANELSYELATPLSSLHQLAEEEKFKVFTVLNTFFASLPRHASYPQITYVFIPQKINISDSRWHHHSCYCPHNSLFTWLYYDSLFYRPGRWSSINNHHSHSSKKKEEVMLLLLITMMAIAVGAAFVAAYYLLREFLDSQERLWMDEGWLQAVISFSSAIGSTAVAGLFAALFASAPLAAFAVAAGISNPVGVVVLGVICLSLIGGALGCFITNQIQNYIIKENNKDALDPLDPHRYGLTPAQEYNLIQKGLDPIKVKCAIVALHEQIGKEIPPLLHRIFSDSDGKQALLKQIRDLRNGQTGYMITVGTGSSQLNFDLRSPIPVQPNIHTHSSRDEYNPEPSAPLAYPGYVY
ncbi:hypothetical protein [Legionella jamestowniensis]|uniref:Uncharacterized protein n=1 Tax=Legionella jamestowniensis TaxID=455 RepID=A0A0W0UL21_9GAMM|nr:hypothetical protein [Legionella jamestowniensis]KTD08584.1 hypothetical protein Ljam_2779 [Legionella jamestowniensis]OCH96964.1 hypothetical protein A8135_04825 [Legionella jamestowniensis]SFL53201.1 hypothetical protein SAMN02746073_0728 [Legionella jamestowniensis DSM 19215]